MVIFPPLTLHVDRWLKQGAYLAAIAFGALCMSLLLFVLLYSWGAKEETGLGAGKQQKGGRAFFPYEAIGTGGLALHPRHALGWVSRLVDELALLSYNSRPDIDSKEAKILLSLKNGKEQLMLSNGQTLYLKESEQGKGLHASEDPTALWVKPILLDNGAVVVEAGRKLLSKEGKVGEEKGQFIVVQQEGIPMRYNPSQQPFMQELKLARSFPQDLLIQKYGGREYSGWRDKAVLELTCGTASYACFVSVGDYLLYDEGEWRSVSKEMLKLDRPIARIKSATGKSLEIEAWDETGLYPFHIKIDMEKQGSVQLKPELMPSAIRLRSANQVSCAFGKRRVILKPGDWLLKTATGWRSLRKSEDIEKYLHHRLKGELLIFDSIEKEQGRSVMKGHLFDATRVQVQPLTLPIDAEKVQNKTSGKRKPIQSNSERRAG